MLNLKNLGYIPKKYVIGKQLNLVCSMENNYKPPALFLF